MFHVGQKIVCVNDDAVNIAVLSGLCDVNFYWPNRPKKGGIYTLRDVMFDEVFCIYGLRLVEIVNPVRLFVGGFREGGFREDQFRPLEERKTDISVFQRMLNGEPVS